MRKNLIKVIPFCMIIINIISFSLAQEEQKQQKQEEIKITSDYFSLAEGNTWEYNISGKWEKEENNSGKIELAKNVTEGKFLTKCTNMGKFDNSVSDEITLELPIGALEKLVS
ncbi:MAG: hypothetical protein ABIH42_07905 [Planctomycetota bacterium]